MCATLVSILGSSRGSPGRTLRKNLPGTGAPLVIVLIVVVVVAARLEVVQHVRRGGEGRVQGGVVVRAAPRCQAGQPEGAGRRARVQGRQAAGAQPERGGGRTVGADGSVGDKRALAVGDGQ